jgi:CCR4-NOT transcriptional complex subunit CAF120
MSGAQGGSLQNVLSISTAANNRYLLHFNSYSSLTQWTAGIRLAMFEHATLQEAYTGSLIAGKGRFLNNIKMIMERARFTHEDWARVRFGAGTPWKRCWCVVSPPDEKEYQKAQKSTKKSAYERGSNTPKGNIKFYDTRKITKKTRPIATITDAYAAYAIYPQSKPLIDQSTLVKLEGLVTIHSEPETTTEGFVFVMPEVHAAVSGFEMMLRWLFPVYDTFGLYGRPQRLIADTLDQRGLMFALPQDRRYGYLDTLDVAGLIHAPGSPAWSERQWRREMKKLTSERMSTYRENGLGSLRQLSQRRNTVSRTSLPGGQGGVRFDDGSDNSAPPSRQMSPSPRNPDIPRRTDSAPPVQNGFSSHKRSASEVQGYRKYMSETPSRLSYEQRRPDENDDQPPPPPRHGGPLGSLPMRPGGPGGLERIQSEAEVPTIGDVYQDMNAQAPPAYQDLNTQVQPPTIGEVYHDMHAQVEPAPSHLLPVDTPPAFQHNPGARPANQPIAPPELRRAHSNVDAATLYQMQDAARGQRTPEEEEYANGHNGQNGQNGNRVRTSDEDYRR